VVSVRLPDMTEVGRYSYRLRPGVHAERALVAEWDRCRFLWNEAVHQQKSGVRPTFGKLGKLLTEARGRTGWLRDGSQVAQQQTLRSYTQALDHSFQVKGQRVVAAHGLIAIEDFKPKFLAKSTMARKAADAAIGGAKRVLIEQGVRAGRRVVLVQPAFTSMTCSKCFARAKRLELCERTFRCSVCGSTAGRDRNAAGVVLVVAERGHVSVEDVRQAGHLLRVGGSVAV
jgi:putative transposase